MRLGSVDVERKEEQENARYLYAAAGPHHHPSTPTHLSPTTSYPPTHASLAQEQDRKPKNGKVK